MAVEDFHQVPEVVGGAEDVAGVGVLGDEAERLPLAAAADEDRDVAADRPWVVVGAGHGWCVPSTVACSSVNIAREMRSASSSSSKRTFSGGNSNP